MIDNIDELITQIKIFQKGDSIHIKNHEVNYKIYYRYDKVIEILNEIAKMKEENYYETRT